ncbi:uncharacterized protein LOC106804388 [Setaria italica]|uniref:uncharacterized protein LOC106804388 n=1 Tax=Setaria italica TaxID=4555 RepID=UPI000BE5F5E9|nr:uncharacterized protein LOC106804388 [Setaria italica]
MTTIFCNIVVEEIAAGNRPLGTLNARGYKNLREKFFTQTGKNYTQKQLKNRWDNLKTLYGFWKSLWSDSGLGRHPVLGIPTASDTWWETNTKGHLRREKKAFRYAPPPCLKQWEIMFEKSHVSGQSACIPGEEGGGDSVPNEEERDDDPIQEIGSEQFTPTSSTRTVLKRKVTCDSPRKISPRKKGKNPMMSSASDESSDDEYSKLLEIAVGQQKKMTRLINAANMFDIIKPKDPEFSIVHPKLQEHRFSPHFHGAIGAIDGTHIPVVVPSTEQITHFGRYRCTTQNVLAVCDFDMRFTFVVAGWPGSVHDTRVFNEALQKYADKFPFPPEGKYYLVDSGYPNRKGFLSPYKGEKYHLPEFRQGPEPRDFVPSVAQATSSQPQAHGHEESDMNAFRDSIADALMAMRE